MPGLDLEVWLNTRYDQRGNAARGRRTYKADDVGPQVLADLLRAAARDLERAAGLRPAPEPTTAPEF